MIAVFKQQTKANKTACACKKSTKVPNDCDES